MEKDKEIHFWGVYVDLSHRLAWLGFGLSLACTFIFWLLMSQGLLPTVYPIVTILCAVLSGLLLIAALLGVYGKHRLNKLTSSEKKDEKRSS